MSSKRSNTRWLVMLSGAVVLMFGFGYALVPLYDLFCEITGIGGKPTIAKLQNSSPDIAIDTTKKVTIEFTATANNNMPWQVTPMVRKTKVHPGEVHVVNYLVKNDAKQLVVGQAIPSISPMKAGRHLVKLACFCFDNQTLAAGESREMPVRFYIDPELPDDIKTLTLSYSFFQLKSSPTEVARNTSS